MPTRHPPRASTIAAALIALMVGATLDSVGPAAVGAQTSTDAAKPTHLTFDKETAGREPKNFLPMVGTWVVTKEAGKNVLFIDGRVWKRGQPAGGLADKAREIYGARNEEFIESIKAFAYFPIAVAKDIDHFENGDITVRFQMIGGSLDRCAGILFNVKPNGDYLTVRYNGTEDNVVLWTFHNGVRSRVKGGTKNVPLELGTWHTLKVSIHGPQIQGYLDNELILEHTWTEPISGKVGVWSKTDSMTEFDDFTVVKSDK